jgi:hypothetical protein
MCALGLGAACSSGGSGSTTTTGGGQCVVAAQITSDTSLGLECTTWSVNSNVKVGSSASPTLTVRAGVKLAFAAGTSIDVGDGEPGGLQVLGTSTSHVTFTSAASSPAAGDWAGIQLASQARSDSSLSYLDLGFAGAAQGLAQQAALVIDGTQDGGADVKPTLVHVAISSSKGSGFFFQGSHTGPGSGSAQLSVAGWDSASSGHFYPFVIDPDAAGMLPVTLSATPSSPTAAVSLQNYQKKDVVDTTQTWPALSLPYLLGADGTTDGLTIGGPSATVLTVAAPNTLQFTHAYGITVSNDPTNTNMNGTLVASASSGSPITFTSASSSPAAGDWAGIQFQFGASGSGDSSLTFCNIQYAGGIYQVNTDYGAVTTIGNAPFHVCDLAGPTIQSCTFSGIPSGQNGIIAAQVSTSQTNGYASQNTFPSGITPVLVEPCS